MVKDINDYQKRLPKRSKEAISRSLQDLRNIIPKNDNLAQKSSLSLNDLTKYSNELPILTTFSKPTVKEALKNVATKITNCPKFLYQNPTINAVVAPFSTTFKSLYQLLSWMAQNPVTSFLVQTTLFSLAISAADTDTSNFATVESINQLQNNTLLAVEQNRNEIETLYDVLAYLSTDLKDKMPKPIPLNASNSEKLRKIQQEILIQKSSGTNLAFVADTIQNQYKTNYSSNQLREFGKPILHKLAITELFANKSTTPLDKMKQEFTTYIDLVFDDSQNALKNRTFLENYPSILNSQEYEDMYNSINTNNGNLNDLHNFQQEMMAKSKNETLDIVLEDIINRPTLYLDENQIQEIKAPQKKITYTPFDPFNRLTMSPDKTVLILKQKLCQYLQTNLTSTDYKILFSQPTRKTRFGTRNKSDYYNTTYRIYSRSLRIHENPNTPKGTRK